jgi:hypothetical protein
LIRSYLEAQGMRIKLAGHYLPLQIRVLAGGFFAES